MNTNLIDASAGAGLLLFTGAEISSTSGIMEIISNFGVIAVLWFWLQSMKSQMAEQLKTYEKHTMDLRKEHKEQIKLLSEIHDDYKDRIDKHIMK